MKRLVSCLMIALLALNVSACGVKGRLKTPDQIKHAEEKKARQDAKKKAEQEKQQKQDAAPVTEPRAEEP